MKPQRKLFWINWGENATILASMASEMALNGSIELSWLTQKIQIGGIKKRGWNLEHIFKGVEIEDGIYLLR